MRQNGRSRGLDATHSRFAAGDLVTTTKGCWFGPGIRGEVQLVTRDVVTLAADLGTQRLFTVRHCHVLVVERRTGLVARLRELWRRVSERTTR